MTKEQFALAAEGAGFIPAADLLDVWRHPIFPLFLTLRPDGSLDIWTENYGVTYPLTPQRLTHLFKAFQK